MSLASSQNRKRASGYLITCTLLLTFAAAFRIAVAHWLPNDAPDDGRVYAQMARNVLEQHVYSHDAQAPYGPSLIRVPGYPLLLAGVYSMFGHTNNGAVRVVQALIDTATCGLVALLAFYWQPDEQKKHASAVAALALAAVCPFTTIYAATILTEVPTNFLVMAMILAATLALRKKLITEDTDEQKNKGLKQSLLWWIAAGVIGGLAVLFRPDNGLFVAAVGLTLVISSVGRIWSAPAESRLCRDTDGALDDSGLALGDEHKEQNRATAHSVQREDSKRRRRNAATPAGLPRWGPRPLPAHAKKVLARMFLLGAIFSVSFAAILIPWTIRNWRVFHLFQPLSPAHGEMPGEFVPRGYELWVRSWLDDESYIGPFLWSLDSEPIDIDDVPPHAFDSVDEKNRVASLLDKYNHPDGTPAVTPSPSPSATPQPSPTAAPTRTKPGPTPPQQNSNANSAEESSDEENEESEEESETEQTGPVEMTPEIDAGFAQIAHERIARHRFQFYVWLPIKRVRTMWLDTHSQYWPFEGSLLPFEDLDYAIHQQIWLPLFAGLTAIYTLLGLAGAWFLWASERFDARQWLLLAGLAIVLRLILFSSIENPEPRYVVEFFPFLSVLGGIAIAHLGAWTSLAAARVKRAE